MRSLIIFLPLLAILATGCNGAVIDRIRDEQNGDGRTPIVTPAESATRTRPVLETRQSTNVSINNLRLTDEDVHWLEATYGLYVDDGDYWYDPVSGAWGYWGGPASGFLMPSMELGYPPIDASGGGTGVVLNGRELHPYDLAGLEQLLGYIYPGYYWLDANGYFGYEGGQALGNLIYIAQGYGSSAGGGSGGYYESTYFGNIGSDGQSSYFYDSDTGCSVMSGGGVSC